MLPKTGQDSAKLVIPVVDRLPGSGREWTNGYGVGVPHHGFVELSSLEGNIAFVLLNIGLAKMHIILYCI